MKKRWIFVLAPLALVAFITLGGEVVALLWNWLAPALFGLRQITFWQALGLLALCRILFGNFGGHGSRGPKGRNRWQKMTPEEHEKFRESMRARCGFGPSASSEQA